MNDEENYLPWVHYKPFYELNKEGFDKIKTNSCFRVRCKLCEPALKTIGTNKTSSSNLWKHLKSVHPQYLPQVELFAVRRRKREVLEESESRSKKPLNVEDFQGAEKDFLCQLMSEYQELFECKPTDVDLNARSKKLWESITIAFNEAGIGVKRNKVQLKNLWEKIKKNKERDEKYQNTSVECSRSTPKSEIMVTQTNFSSQSIGENALIECEDVDEAETDILQPVVTTHLRSEDAYSNVEIDSGDQSLTKYNDIQREMEEYSRVEQESGIFLLEDKLKKDKINEQLTQPSDLRAEQEIRTQMLKNEIEHQRNLMKLELYHKKSLNIIERNMKEEELKMKKVAFFAEERRKEERHRLELALLTGTKTEVDRIKDKLIEESESHNSEHEVSVLQKNKSVFSHLKIKQDGLIVLEGKHKDISVMNDEATERLSLLRKSDEHFVSQGKEESPNFINKQLELELSQESSSLTQDNEPEIIND